MKAVSLIVLLSGHHWSSDACQFPALKQVTPNPEFIMSHNLLVVKCRPSQLDYDPSQSKLDEHVWKSSSVSDENELSQVRRHYDNRYSHRRHNLVSSAVISSTIQLQLNTLSQEARSQNIL